jgi:hypothetical protein
MSRWGNFGVHYKIFQFFCVFETFHNWILAKTMYVPQISFSICLIKFNHLQSKQVKETILKVFFLWFPIFFYFLFPHFSKLRANFSIISQRWTHNIGKYTAPLFCYLMMVYIWHAELWKNLPRWLVSLCKCSSTPLFWLHKVVSE